MDESKIKRIWEEFRKGYHILKWLHNDDFKYYFDAVYQNKRINLSGLDIPDDMYIEHEISNFISYKGKSFLRICSKHGKLRIGSKYCRDIKKIGQAYYLFFIADILIPQGDILEYTQILFKLKNPNKIYVEY